MSARLAAILLSSAALFATSPAFAIEPEDAADALAAALTGTGGGEGDYEEASLDGSNVVITGLSLSHGSETDKESITFERDGDREPCGRRHRRVRQPARHLHRTARSRASPPARSPTPR